MPSQVLVSAGPGTTPQINFKALTRAQQDVLGLIAIGMDTGHHPKVIDRLCALGLIEESWQALGRDALGAIRIARYEMPIWAHIQWCQWCSSQYGGAE